YAFCRGNVEAAEGSLSLLMAEKEASSASSKDGMSVKSLETGVEEQGWYKFNETTPGTSSCQNAPAYLGTFCGEWTLFVLPPAVRGIYITPGSTGITRTTTAANFDYMLDSVTVYVNITHPHTSDLVVKIISPNGTEKTVFNRVSGTDVTLEVNVTDFNNENPEGTWSLKVVDNYNNPTYTGRLTSWGVKLNSSGYKRIEDSSIYKRHASYNGASYGTGMVNGYVGLDGSDDQMVAGAFSIPAQFTVTGWIYPTSTSGTREIVHAKKYLTESSTPTARIAMVSGKIRMYVNSSYKESATTISTNAWTHFAVSFNKIDSTHTRVRLYLNNVLNAEDTLEAVANSTTGIWTLGSHLQEDYTFTNRFIGRFDEFRIYGEVLSRYERDLVFDAGCSTDYYRRSNKTCYNSDSCGDGRMTGTEECEDRNTESCNSSCQLIDGYYKDPCWNSCENTYYQTYTQCGDGYTAGDETCDDGNTVVEGCPVYNQSCTVCGDECTSEAGIMEYCGDGILQPANEECDGSANCTACACNTGYEPNGSGVCVDVCQNVDCGTHGACSNYRGFPVCLCEERYVDKISDTTLTCVPGWFADDNLAAAVVEVLQINGFDVEDELDIDPSYMFDDIKYLYLGGKEISSIVGIRLFPNLVALDLSNNNIADLWPLGQKESLVELSIAYNPVSDASILSTLSLSNLNISNSAIYDYSAIKEIDSLEIFSDSNDNYRTTTHIRPDNITVPDWFWSAIQGADCSELMTVIELIGGEYYRRTIPNDSCSGHGTCIVGNCVCDPDYTNVDGACLYNGSTCGVGQHKEGGVCKFDTINYPCDVPRNGVINPGSNIVIWDGVSNYFPPNGKNTSPCYYEHECISSSICIYHCPDGFTILENGECEANAYRDIPNSLYNQLLFPKISRQDVVLEPIPGVPSFAPSLSLKMYYGKNPSTFSAPNSYGLQTGWYLNLPRVELTGKNMFGSTPALTLFQLGWDEKTLTVYMPWGSEEYSVVVSEECYNESDELTSCESTYSYKEMIFFPSPGQNVFSHIVLKIVKFSDNWTVTRFGDDGSETIFKKTTDKPSWIKMIDYIPMTSYTTRDEKEVKIEYDYEYLPAGTVGNHYYYSMKEIRIIDPVDRVIRIVSTNTNGSGLMGDPDSFLINGPLSGGFEIFTGHIDEGAIFSEKKVVDYYGIQEFDMTVEIIKNNQTYRTDQYYAPEKEYNLSSETDASHTTWEIKSSGYTEYKKVNAAVGGTPEKWIKKQVSGGFYGSSYFPTGVNSQNYPISYKFFDSDMENGHILTTTYSEIKGSLTSGAETKIRKSTETINDWFQLTKREECSTDNTGACIPGEISTERIGYNVNGSPVYHQAIDGQVSMDLYNEYNVSAANYNIYYSYYGMSAVNQLRYAGKIKCSGNYSKDSSRDFEDILSDYANDGTVYIQNWCENASDLKATAYLWSYESSGKPYDLQIITYPDGRTGTFTYDYEISSSLFPAGYTPKGKVWGETTTGSNSQNTINTCYAYNNNYNLIAQGIGTAENCSKKKGFVFDVADTNSIMIEDFSYNNSSEVLSNKYIYDDLGRKIVERNSAEISTIYVYDDLDRVVFTFFGCDLPDNVFPDTNSTNAQPLPYNFNGSDFDGEYGVGVTFSNNGSLQFPYNTNANLIKCQYYRKYKYDKMSNLTYTYLFDYWDSDETGIFKPT
ncbi:MAG TPA: proprotein convertase P-domain-containing protein, partial [bacterium]|nr:proprotein convertase P-domain-containing protein [bacterium]